MTTTIALAGKGGTGKTTVAALLVDILVQRGALPVLAIDADPSSNLNLALGVPLTRTVGDLREDLLADVQRTQMALGVSQREMLDVQVRQAVEEADDFDLIAMGRPEGPGCYCAGQPLAAPDRGHHERELRLRGDGQRGRHGAPQPAHHPGRGLAAAAQRPHRARRDRPGPHDPHGRRPGHRRQEQGHRAQPRAALPQNGGSGIPPAVQAMLDSYDAPLVGVIPADPLVNQYDAEGLPLAHLPADSAARRAVAGAGGPDSVWVVVNSIIL